MAYTTTAPRTQQPGPKTERYGLCSFVRMVLREEGGTLGAEPVALLIRASQRRAVAKVMVRSATLFAHADHAFVIVTATDYAAPRGIVVNTEAWTTRRHTPVCARTKDSQNIAFPCV